MSAPSLNVQADSVSGVLTAQKSTDSAAHVMLTAGTNNIGDVDVLSLPSIPAGTNNIGDVDVLSLPPIPAGTNNIGDVDVLTLPPIPSGTNNIGGITGTGIMVAASVDVNAAIAADVDAAVAAQAGLRLIGFATRESAATAAAATFIIVHGATAAGTAVVPVELAANESAREWFGPDGIACPDGISIDWIAGTVDIHLFYKVVV